MAVVFGENGLVYIGGVAVPNVNDWEVAISQDKIEAPKVMVCPPSAAASWLVKTGGYFSASLKVSTLYDDTTQTPITQALADQSYLALVYPICTDVTEYWSGQFWLQVTNAGSVDGYVTLDIDGESTGQVQWI